MNNNNNTDGDDDDDDNKKYVTRQLPASTKGFMGGRRDLYFVYRRIYGELLLIFICILTVTQITKTIF